MSNSGSAKKTPYSAMCSVNCAQMGDSHGFSYGMEKKNFYAHYPDENDAFAE